MAGIRTGNQAMVEAALATNEPDGVALAAASALAERQGTSAIAELVKKAASAKPAASLPPAIAVPASALPALEGRYLSATSSAAVTVAASGGTLTLAAPGETALVLQPFEERRWRAVDAPETIVTFAGRGGIVERLRSRAGPRSSATNVRGLRMRHRPRPFPQRHHPRRPRPALRQPVPHHRCPRRAASLAGVPRRQCGRHR